MLKPIGVKDGKVMSVSELFSHLTDEDLVTLAEADQLDMVCRSLTLELMSYPSTKNEA